ncbi:hypothetical protein, partial [uncultured Nostoc sp.]|uniref:hypothetical protein n=1 Tax=uncultured Nostoc sp. TaxID=340711 RepID=UPI0035CBF07A
MVLYFHSKTDVPFSTGRKLCATVIFNPYVYLLITLSKSLIALSKSLFTLSKHLNAFSKEAFAFSNSSLLNHF